ncbi:MAG: hypothetical protein ACI97A_001042 [Planctomycetota bacterium]|jgi:hypothetical protein
MSRKIFNPAEGHPYYFLGAVLALLAMLYPILGIGRWGLVIWTLSFWVVLVAAIHATGRRRRVRTSARWLGSTALIAGIVGLGQILAYGESTSAVRIIVDVLTLVFLMFATGAVLFEVLTTKRVDVDHLIGASASYVLLGLTFTYAFLALQEVTGDAILISRVALQGQTITDPGLADFLYFSFVSLTTLGFGDIVPITMGARVLTTVEAIAGQLFLTILVARLIGLHIADSRVSH